MKKNLSVVLGTFILLTMCCAPSAFALGFGARANYWFPTFKGDLRVDGNGVPGTEINLKNDLGISVDNTFSAEAYFGIGKHEISLMYSRINLFGAKYLERNIVFNGDTYNAHSYVESDLTTDMIDFEYQYKFLNFENILAGLSIGVIGKVKYFDGEARMHSPTPGPAYDTQKDFHIPIPMIGVGAKIGLVANILEVRAKIAGMGYSENYYYDALADISVTPYPFLNLYGGFRAMSLKIDNISDVYGKMDFYGPYAGLAVSF